MGRENDYGRYEVASVGYSQSYRYCLMKWRRPWERILIGTSKVLVRSAVDECADLTCDLKLFSFWIMEGYDVTARFSFYHQMLAITFSFSMCCACTEDSMSLFWQLWGRTLCFFWLVPCNKKRTQCSVDYSDVNWERLKYKTRELGSTIAVSRFNGLSYPRLAPSTLKQHGPTVTRAPSSSNHHSPTVTCWPLALRVAFFGGEGKHFYYRNALGCICILLR
jgi:hypothetical protein